MFPFILGYLLLSITIHVVWIFSSTEQYLAEVKPALGRRILLLILTPSVLIFGTLDLICMVLKRERAWDEVPGAFRNFLYEAKEVWDGE